MRLFIPAPLLVTALLAGCILSTGCGSVGIKRVDAGEFTRYAERMEQVSSATHTTYIGITPARAYIEYTNLCRIFPLRKTVVYWTELEGLPEDVRSQLEAGELPWTPWTERFAAPNKESK